MAFYFSARGDGYQVNRDGTRRPYTTTAKVYFSGLGADEQLGYLVSVVPFANDSGYSRHTAAWKRSNGDWNAIIREVHITSLAVSNASWIKT